MLCRHNKHVQDFGRMKDADEIARRERVWQQLVDEVEFETGRQAGSLSAREFRRQLESRVDLRSFKPRRR
jgi:hypothetical protein